MENPSKQGDIKPNINKEREQIREIMHDCMQMLGQTKPEASRMDNAADIKDSKKWRESREASTTNSCAVKWKRVLKRTRKGTQMTSVKLSEIAGETNKGRRSMKILGKLLGSWPARQVWYRGKTGKRYPMQKRPRTAGKTILQGCIT